MTHTGCGAGGDNGAERPGIEFAPEQTGRKCVESTGKRILAAVHNPEVVGSNPASATMNPPYFREIRWVFCGFAGSRLSWPASLPESFPIMRYGIWDSKRDRLYWQDWACCFRSVWIFTFATVEPAAKAEKRLVREYSLTNLVSCVPASPQMYCRNGTEFQPPRSAVRDPSDPGRRRPCRSRGCLHWPTTLQARRSR